jgi:hypothetical protein
VVVVFLVIVTVEGNENDKDFERLVGIYLVFYFNCFNEVFIVKFSYSGHKVYNNPIIRNNMNKAPPTYILNSLSDLKIIL